VPKSELEDLFAALRCKRQVTARAALVLDSVVIAAARQGIVSIVSGFVSGCTNKRIIVGEPVRDVPCAKSVCALPSLATRPSHGVRARPLSGPVDKGSAGTE